MTAPLRMVLPMGLATDVALLADEGTAVDGRGHRVDDWRVFAHRRGSVLDTGRQEVTQGTRTLIVDAKLWLPDTTVPLDGFGRVRARGKLYEVQGTPYLVPDSVGPHHIEAWLRSWQGGT